VRRRWITSKCMLCCLTTGCVYVCVCSSDKSSLTKGVVWLHESSRDPLASRRLLPLRLRPVCARRQQGVARLVSWVGLRKKWAL
jgi:hypothetical protein